MRKIATLALAFSATGFTSFVLAHGGHSVTLPAGFVHYLFEPLHVIPALVTLAVLVIAVRVVWSRVH